MLLRESLRSRFSVTLGKQILCDQSLDMPGVSRDSLDCNFMGGSGDPVLGVLRPIAEDLLVNFVCRSFVAVDGGGDGS